MGIADGAVAIDVAGIGVEVLIGPELNTDTTTRSQAARAASIRLSWPAWSDPMVGTSPTVSPAAFQAAIRAFMDPTVSTISMVASYRFSSTPSGAA